MPNTAKLHRVLKAPPERVYRAFTEPDALCRWMPPFGWVGKVFSMDVKVGGTFKMSFVNFSNGMEHNFGGEYLEIIPNEKLHYTDTFDDPNIPGTITVTVTFKRSVSEQNSQLFRKACRILSRSKPAIWAGRISRPTRKSGRTLPPTPMLNKKEAR